jgi:hypothetical protein
LVSRKPSSITTETYSILVACPGEKWPATWR